MTITSATATQRTTYTTQPRATSQSEASTPERALPGHDTKDRFCAGDSAAHDTFNAFHRDLAERYAVFDARLPEGKTWDSIGRVSCEQIRAGMPDGELYDTMLGMVQQLDDGHTELVAGDLGREEDAEVSVYPHGEAMDALEGNAEARYITGGELTTAANDTISWGRIVDPTGKNPDLGYISITGMEDLSETGEEADDVLAAREAMQQAMAELGDVSGMIVDVRGNGGGWDDVSLEVARWFEGPRQLAWTKQAREGDGFGPEVREYVEQSPPGAYKGPVTLLTSGATYSAAETFALAMRERPNVQLAGEPTSGHLSDQYGFDGDEAPVPGEDGVLPNGWTYRFSGERYVDAGGAVWENAGVPVDARVDFDPAAFAEGRDVMLEAARDLLWGLR